MTADTLPAIPPLANLHRRSRILTAIRHFFQQRDFMEVETPLRIPAPALELYIDAPPAGNGYWLRTSPELHMKRLLVAGCERIYQLGACFRVGERGRRHNPEFTMLEWYRLHADYRTILQDSMDLVGHVVQEILGGDTLTVAGQTICVTPPWHVLTVQDAFTTMAGWDPTTAYDADRFDLDMVNLVEPALPRDRPVVLIDYPAAAAALARLKSGNPTVAERWELYINGMELANAYSELTDHQLQLARFMDCATARRDLGREVYPLDEPFLAALAQGLPPTGGIALGVDRLVMLLCNAATIDHVRPFCTPQ